jgi:hypothetical protein
VGYEVIDEHGPVSGADRSVTGSTRRQEPYDFDTLEPLEPTPSAAERMPGRPDLRRLLHLPAVLASCALLVGAIVGGYVVHQHNVGKAAAQERSVLQAVAVAENQMASGVNGVRVATLTVRLTNFGPEPIQPVLSDDGHTPSQVSPLVQASTEHPEAEAKGGDAMVTITVPLACDQELGDLLLPVRTVDHRVHQVSVHSPDSAALQQDRTMCNDGGIDEPTLVEASLSGDLDNPYVVIRNKATQARRIWLGEPGPGGSIVGPRGVTIRLEPKLPQDVEGNGTLRLKLVVTASRCERDVAALEQANTWIAFQDTHIGMGVQPPLDGYRGYIGVGLSSLITNAFVRACH